MHRMPFRVMGLVGLALLVAGCPATYQARKAKESGFLRDYSQLREGKVGEALLVYVRPGVDWKRYDKVLIEPIQVWHDAARAGMFDQEVPKAEAQVLADYLDASLRHALKDDYEFADRPGPGVLRLRIAITEAEGSSVPLDVVSTVVPQMRALSGVKRVATGTAAFVGKAGVEAEIIDGMTDERLGAAIDRRVGQKRLRGMLNTWDDVQGAFDHWSERLRTRLAELRAGKA